ncbi:hypothetical protein [Halobellus marinus]|uniref:hypothetical protein n=1 Tax=Halobellus TaxID=1073986 RepID=UPI0028B0046B|nr:hypothetical protein [Halobellus sp. DFY28]
MPLVPRALTIAREDGVRTLFRKGRAHGLSVIGATLADGVQRLNRIRYRATGGETRITDADWDDLILLDGCRYDQFERLHTLGGDVESRVSVGSATPEFLERTFANETCFDTVYVTANPMYRHVGLDDVFHAVIDVWRSDWDEERKTVWPEAMVEATHEAHQTYPNKRVLTHFMQPHYPFLGETGREIAHSGFEWSKRLVGDGESSRDDPTVWTLASAGRIDEDTVRVAYDENLQLVMPHVAELVDSTDGRTIVTADHGNLIGERIAPLDGRRYGHPRETYIDGLRKVPRLVIEGTRRRQIEAEPPGEEAEIDRSTVRDRFADFGYLDP